MRPNSVQVVHVDATTADNLEIAILALLSVALVAAGSAVVVEKAVKPSSVDENVARAVDAETPCVGVGNRETVCGHHRIWELGVFQSRLV